MQFLGPFSNGLHVLTGNLSAFSGIKRLGFKSLISSPHRRFSRCEAIDIDQATSEFTSEK